MKYAIEVSEHVSFELDVSPGLPALRGVTLSFGVGTPDEFRELVEKCAGPAGFSLDPSSRLQTRYGIPVTCDGEKVSHASLNIWLDGSMRQPTPEYSVVRELLDEQMAVPASDELPVSVSEVIERG